MKVVNLTENSQLYTSNAYLVTGSWNTLEDINTVIDAGRDPATIEVINRASTGVGKKKVEQLIITHNHYDHTGMIMKMKAAFKPEVLAFSSNVTLVDRVLKNGEILSIADASFEVIHMPGHSTDSICLYCKEEKVLFAGDSPLVIKTTEGAYDESFVSVLKRLARLPIEAIYFGHGSPLTDKCNEVLRRSLKNISTTKNKHNRRNNDEMVF